MTESGKPTSDTADREFVHVVVPMEDGIVHDVYAFRTEAAAAEAEAEWLKSAEIHTEKEREERSDWGTGIAIWECELNP